MKFFSDWLVKQLQSLFRQTTRCEEQLYSWNRQLYVWQKLHVTTKELIRLLPSHDETIIWNLLDNILLSAKSQYSDVANQMATLPPSVKQLYQRMVRDDNLAKEWLAVGNNASQLNAVLGKSLTYVSRLKDSWQHLLRDRAARGEFLFKK